MARARYAQGVIDDGYEDSAQCAYERSLALAVRFLHEAADVHLEEELLGNVETGFRPRTNAVARRAIFPPGSYGGGAGADGPAPCEDVMDPEVAGALSPEVRALEWYIKLFFGVHFADNLA